MDVAHRLCCPDLCGAVCMVLQGRDKVCNSSRDEILAYKHHMYSSQARLLSQGTYLWEFRIEQHVDVQNT